MIRLQDGCEWVNSEKGAGLSCISSSTPLLPPYLFLSVIFTQSLLPHGSPVLNSCCSLAHTTDQKPSSQSLGSNSWDKKTLVDPVYPFEPGHTSRKSGQPMDHPTLGQVSILTQSMVTQKIRVTWHDAH